jgi:methylase of polypeptide subunit release factors
MAADIFSEWLAALEARHLADLRVPEVTRALRALSSAYVERRHALARGAALDSHGKRAAFALFYAPLHFMVVRHVVTALGAHRPAPSTVVDLGCGTGAAGLLSGERRSFARAFKSHRPRA